MSEIKPGYYEVPSCLSDSVLFINKGQISAINSAIARGIELKGEAIRVERMPCASGLQYLICVKGQSGIVINYETIVQLRAL